MSEITIQVSEKHFDLFKQAIKNRGFESPEEYLDNIVIGEIIDFRRNQQYQREKSIYEPAVPFNFNPLVESVQSIAKSLATIEKDILEVNKEICFIDSCEAKNHPQRPPVPEHEVGR